MLAVLFTSAYGQVDQGKIQGAVKDSTGGVIPGVSITIKNDRTGEERETITGDRGDYVMTALKPSTYLVRASLAGFSSKEVTGVQLNVGQTLTIDLSLSPANVTQEVSVSADAAEVRVETSTAAMGANVDVREVAELPINGRQLSQLYLQAPGAQNTGNGQYNDIRFNGRATDQNAVRFDGIEASGIVDASPGVLKTFRSSVSSPIPTPPNSERVAAVRSALSQSPAAMHCTGLYLNFSETTRWMPAISLIALARTANPDCPSG
jgi:hypothetical protein